MRLSGARAGAAVAVLVLATIGAACPGRSDLTFGISAAEHAAYFPIDAASVHALDRVAIDGAIGCASCHGGEESFADFSCISCHEHRQRGVDPDGSRGMDEVHAGDGAYRYESASCLSCHPGGLAAEFSRAEHERFFPIDTGTPHVVTNCAGCHTDSGNRAVVTCTGCHQDTDGDGAGDHDAAPMDAAHGTGMAALGYVWETSRCLGCHPRGEDPGRLDAHDDVFPIATGAVHADRACTDCHASRQDRGALTCTACHEGESAPDAGDGEHGEARMLQAHGNGAIDGYSWDSVACYGCHQQSQVPGVLDHERFFPIGAGTTHALGSSIDAPAVVVSCQSCHIDPGNARNVDCLSCHAHDEATLLPTHTPFPDYRHESESCVFCHQGGQRRLDHPFFPVAGGTFHALDNADTPAVVDGLLCGECHASQINRTLLSCTSCHEHTATIEADHHGAELARFGYRHEAAACFTCHAQAQVPGLMDHEPIWPLQAPSGNGRHANRPCIDCHTSRENRAANLSCTACHEPTSAADSRDVHGEPRLAEVHNGISGYAFTPTVCVDCHRDGTGAGAAANLLHDRFPIGAGTTHAVTGNGGQIDCVDCHTTAGRFDLATLDCRACHLQVNDGGGARDVHGEPRLGALHAGVTDYAWATPSCLECHPNGEPLGTFAHDDFPVSTGTAHDGVGCNECHGNANRTDRTALQCAQCHSTTVNRNPTVAQLHTGVPAFGATSPDCLRCHPTANKVGPMEHNSYFPVDTGTAHGGAAYQAKVAVTETSCTACHLSRTNRAQNDCAACHATVPPALATAHSRVRGFSATNSGGCKECHADADVFRLSAHRAFDPRHEGARCNQCHQQRRVDKPWAINFTGPTNCVGCHHSAGCSYTNQGPCD